MVSRNRTESYELILSDLGQEKLVSSIKCVEFINQLWRYQPLKKDSVPWSQLVGQQRKRHSEYVISELHELHAANSNLEANICWTSQEIPHILWNMKISYSARRCPPLTSVLSRVNVIHYVLKIHSDIILSSTNPFSIWFLCSRFSQRAYPFAPLRATCPADFILLV